MAPKRSDPENRTPGGRPHPAAGGAVAGGDYNHPAAGAPTDELDLVEGGRPRPPSHRRRHVHPPHVKLGHLDKGGVAPAIMAIVERGVRRRPALAKELTAEIELAMLNGYPPVRIVFGEHVVLVEDGPGQAPDLRIEGTLPDLVSLLVTPLLGGVPSPINARGRAALGMVAFGRVKVTGRMALMRRFLRVIRV